MTAAPISVPSGTRARAAFFDMDNTLLRVETGMSWVRFLRARGELSAQMVAKAIYWHALYKLAVLDMDTVFTRLVESLRGDSEAEMIAKCEIWYRDHVAPEVAPAARVALEHHRRAGHVIVLATGSIFAGTLVHGGSNVVVKALELVTMR